MHNGKTFFPEQSTFNAVINGDYAKGGFIKACKDRFTDNTPLPFGGFPSSESVVDPKRFATTEEFNKNYLDDGKGNVTVNVVCDDSTRADEISKVLSEMISEVTLPVIQKMEWPWAQDTVAKVKGPQVVKTDDTTEVYDSEGRLRVKMGGLQDPMVGVDSPVLTKLRNDQDDAIEHALEAPQLGVYRPNLKDRKVGKVRVELVDNGFPLALRELAKVMTWAQTAKGYKDHDWQNLPDAEVALAAAASRHRTDYIHQRLVDGLAAKDCVDPESAIVHKAHELFGVIAQLELLLRGKFE